MANHKRMKSPSVAYELVPQLTGDLKAHIELQIKNNKLNERLVSLAPMVSYSFWKLCCVEYAKQLITNNCALSAVPYLMASYNVMNNRKKYLDKKNLLANFVHTGDGCHKCAVQSQLFS